VATLLVEADRQIPGRLDAATGAVTLADLSHADVDDLLDDLAVMAMERARRWLSSQKNTCRPTPAWPQFFVTKGS